MRARTITLALLALSVAVAGGGLAYSTRLPAAESARNTGASSSTVVTAPVLSVPRFVAGSRRTFDAAATYQLEVVHEGGMMPIHVEIAGAWQVTVVRVDERGVLLASELVGTSKPMPELAGQLARTHYIELSLAGRLVRAHFDLEQGDLARGIIQSLAAPLQLAGIERASDAWEAEETDATGRYVAAFSRSSSTIEKTKLRYVEVADGATVRDLVSQSVYRLDGMQWPESVTIDERLAIGKGGVALRVRSRIALSRSRLETVALGELDLSHHEAEQVGRPGATRHNPRTDRQTLAGATFEDLMIELARLDAETGPELAERLEAILRLEPGRAGELAARVLAGADRRTSRLLVDTLGTAGTQEAQRALVELIGSELASRERAHVAVAMATIEVPSADVTSALQETLGAADRTLANASALALGVAALRLRKAEDSRAAAIVDDLIARLAATTDPVAQVSILRALGNAADPRSLPALRVALASENPRVRKVAVEALRSIEESTVDGLIAQVMLGDSDPAVRQGAVFASASRAIDPMLAPLTRAIADRDDEVRIEVAKSLGAHPGHPGVRVLLERLAARDPVDAVRAEAQRQLAGG